MKKLYTLIAATTLLIVSATSSFSQCAGNRYHNYVFPTVPTPTSGIVYGSNVTSGGTTQSLLLDVYQPVGDVTTNRPLVIMVHGGSFIGGSKTGTDVVPLCKDLARLGYVTSSIDYRLGMTNFPFGAHTVDSADAGAELVRATHDARAAVRFFRKNARIGGNTYGIDTNNIYMAGVSAGGLTALHLAYLDQWSEFPTYIDTTGVTVGQSTGQPGMHGGIQGNSGNPGYPSTVKAIVNICGALGDTAWMHTGDIPLLSFHGNADGTVPYGYATISVVGFPLLKVSGSSVVAVRANHLGIPNCMETWLGQDHVPEVSSPAYYDSTITITRTFLEHFMCSTAQNCNYTPTPVVVPPPPAPTATSTVVYCQGDAAVALSATATGGNTLYWSTVATGGIPSATAIIPNTAVQGTTTYYVSQVSAAGAESPRIPINVTIHPLPAVPTVSASGPTSFCTGGSVTLTSSYASGNTWSSSQTTDTIIVNTTGNYSVTYTDVNGCTSTSTATSVNASNAPLPTIAVAGSTTICQGQSTTLTASTSDSYLWSPGGDTTQSVQVVVSGNYNVTTTNANVCNGVGQSTTTTITVNPSPTASGTMATSGYNVTFTNTSTGGTSYVWNFGDATATSSVMSPVHAYAANGNYTVTLVASNGTCSDTTILNVYISVGIATYSTIGTINVYPNPANTTITVDLKAFDGHAVTIELYDAIGNKVKNITGIKDNQYIINRDNLSSGIYFMNVISEGKVFSKKVMFE